MLFKVYSCWSVQCFFFCDFASVVAVLLKFPTQAPLKTQVAEDRMLFLTEKRSVPLPIIPQLNNHGCYTGSLSQVVRWLGSVAEEMGVEIYPGFAASEVGDALTSHCAVAMTRTSVSRYLSIALHIFSSSNRSCSARTDRCKVSPQTTLDTQRTETKKTHSREEWNSTAKPHSFQKGVGVISLSNLSLSSISALTVKCKHMELG